MAYSEAMTRDRHVVVVHHAPLVVEAVAMVLSMQGCTVHAAATYTEAKTILRAFGEDIEAVIAHGDMPNEPLPGTLLRLVRATNRATAIVVLSARSDIDIGPWPPGAVLLREPFDRADLIAALAAASKRLPPLPPEMLPAA
jgi:DNA-binding response OmpR family regulator